MRFSSPAAPGSLWIVLALLSIAEGVASIIQSDSLTVNKATSMLAFALVASAVSGLLRTATEQRILRLALLCALTIYVQVETEYPWDWDGPGSLTCFLLLSAVAAFRIAGLIGWPEHLASTLFDVILAHLNWRRFYSRLGHRGAFFAHAAAAAIEDDGSG